MKNRLAKERVLYNNYDLYEEYYEEAMGQLQDGETDDNEISDNDIWDLVYHWNEIDYEEVINGMEGFFSDGTYILFGEIGRWDGTRTGFDISNDFMSLYNKAVEGCDYIKIYDENGHFHIVCSHHDGTCHYEIKRLTEAGERYFDNWNYNWDDKRSNAYIGNQIIKRYSVIPRYAEKQWGCPKVEYMPVTKEAILNKLNNDARSFYN